MVNQKKKPNKRRNEITAPSVPVTEATIFDGRAYAAEREAMLAHKVAELKSLGVTPKVSVILTSKDPASHLYVRLKQKAAERVGVEMEVFNTQGARRDYKYVMNLIAVLNRDPEVHGAMIQLPLGARYLPYKKWLLEAIVPEKDVDGLTSASPFMPATVKAVISIIEEAQRQVLLRKPPPVFVVGSEGAVGSALIRELTKLGYSVQGYDKKPLADWRDKWGVPSFMSLKADVVVSATGMPGLIEARHIARGAAVIDVGSPKPDVRFREVKAKASFLTPVPGGVGPVTIVSLLENTVAAAYNSLQTTHSVS